MAENLGLYIGKDLIKYAKVSKEKDNVKLEAFGIKFYTDISKAIDQIVQETNSNNIPISVNLTDELYQFFSMFAQLSKKDLEKAVKLEFEAYCTEKGYNANSFEIRYAFIDDVNEIEKIKVINVSENKVDLNKTKDMFNGQKLESISPLPMILPNLIKIDDSENVMIVNLEDKTTVTTLYGKSVGDIQIFDFGSNEILDKINQQEDSYAKAYDILRNTTIYTSDTQSFPEVESEGDKYLEEIMPTIYNIVGAVQQLINDGLDKISRIYITGTLSNINNIDLYFQEYLGDIKCEILKPYFIQSSYKDVNVKEYVDVNSAISLALQGIAPSINGINFKQLQLKDKLNVSIDLFPKQKKAGGSNRSLKLDMDSFKTEMSKTEFSILRLCISILIFIIVYIVFSNLLLKQIEDKEVEVKSLTASIKNEITKVTTDTSKLNSKATEYSTLIEQLNTINDKISEVNENRDLIPNLLNQIMTVIDETVQITSISNPTGKHIVIEAQSPKYQGLGFFKRKLQLNGILQNVVSGSGIKQGEYVTVTIEGDLP